MKWQNMTNRLSMLLTLFAALSASDTWAGQCFTEAFGHRAKPAHGERVLTLTTRVARFQKAFEATLSDRTVGSPRHRRTLTVPCRGGGDDDYFCGARVESATGGHRAFWFRFRYGDRIVLLGSPPGILLDSPGAAQAPVSSSLLPIDHEKMGVVMKRAPIRACR